MALIRITIELCSPTNRVIYSGGEWERMIKTLHTVTNVRWVWGIKKQAKKKVHALLNNKRTTTKKINIFGFFSHTNYTKSNTAIAVTTTTKIARVKITARVQV